MAYYYFIRHYHEKDDITIYMVILLLLMRDTSSPRRELLFHALMHFVKSHFSYYSYMSLMRLYFREKAYACDEHDFRVVSVRDYFPQCSSRSISV